MVAISRNWVVLLAFLLGGSPALADELGDAGPVPIDEPAWDVIEDRILKRMRAIDEIAPFEDKAPLWDHGDAELQKQVTDAKMAHTRSKMSRTVAAPIWSRSLTCAPPLACGRWCVRRVAPCTAW